MIDESSLHNFVIRIVGRFGKKVSVFPRPKPDIIGPAERMKFSEFVTILIDCQACEEGEIFIGFVDHLVPHDEEGGVFSVRIAFSSVNFELEVVSDGVCVEVFDWMGGADADGDVFPLMGVSNLVLVWELP